jgi:anti-anti-sigma regulatory factor
MNCTINRTSSRIVVAIEGELDIARVREFRETLLTVTDDRLPVVVDAKETKRIDMSFLQILHSAQKTLGKLTLVNCPAGVRDYLSRAGVSIDRWSQESSSKTTSVEGVKNG